MIISQQPRLTRSWRKSSHSDTGGNCVEVAQAEPTLVVRDSKEPGADPLMFSAQVWAAFTRRIAHGGCSLP